MSIFDEITMTVTEVFVCGMFAITMTFTPYQIQTTGGCLLSREKAVNDVNSRVGFCFLVGVMLNFDWSIFSWPIQIENNPD